METVSFRKRESREALNEELRFSPPKHKKLSPIGKRPQRSHSDAVSPEKLKIKINLSPKRKHAEHLDTYAKTPKESDLIGSEPKRASSLKYEVVKANDYSVIEFEQDVKARKALDIEKETEIKNNCVAVDDSAVDLDDDLGLEPGYESLNDVKQRINSSDFSNRLSRIKDLTDFHSENVSVITDNSHVDDKLKTTFDDSALNLSEANLNSSKSDPLTSSSKSRDSGFESSKTQSSPDSVPVINDNFKPDNEDYNADEFEIDPGYAECADAIKGTIPLAAFSDGSGSKLSSCQSLDVALDEDEPDYAECADALKGGAVRMRISVSNERLAANDKKSTKTKSNEHIKNSSHSELYANPQILFKKRSIALLTDRSSGEFSNRSSETDRNESFTFSSSESLHRDLKEEQTIVQAPPLPARNYSLYLDNEEAAQLLTDEAQSQNVAKDNTSDNYKDQELNHADDNPFEDFGYAAVDEVKKQIIVTAHENSGTVSANKDNKVQHEDMDVISSKEEKFNEIEDFGYASVKEAKHMKSSDKNCQESENRMEHCVSIAATEKSCSKDGAEFDFGYASVDDVRKEKSTSAESKSENLLEAEMKEKVANKEADLNDRRSSLEIAKLRHVKILEDKFGYASVNNLKRQSSELTTKTIPYSEETMNEICDTLQQNTDKSDKKLDDFGYTSVKEHSKINSEMKPYTDKTSSKPHLKLDSSDFREDDDTKLEDVDKLFTTSPVSEIVSSSFLCSTPRTVNQITPESVQFKSSRLFEDDDAPVTSIRTFDDDNAPVTSRRTLEDDSMEVTVHDMGGSCRVLRIMEKEEPETVIQKRKSIRSSQKAVSQNSDTEKSNEKEISKMSEEAKSEQDQIDIIGSKIEELRLIVSSTPAPSVSLTRAQGDELDLDAVPIDQTIGFVSVVGANQSKLTDSKAEEERESSKHFSTTVHEDFCSQNGQCMDSRQMAVDVLKLSVRTNIQKVSYRSVTDSDSDDSDLKIENLPKLVIDESVFDDSDSSESLDKNITELSQTISQLTEQIEKDINLSDTPSSSVDNRKIEETSPGLTGNAKLSCSCKDENESELGEFISDLDGSNIVGHKQIALVTCSSDGNSNEISNTISDLHECNNCSNTSEDLNERIHMSLEEVISEPIHVSLEDVLKQRHSAVFRDNSGTDINLDNNSALGVLDKAEIDRNSSFSPDNDGHGNENLREKLDDRDKIETKTNAISENQNVDNGTEIENLHLENLHLEISSNSLSCDNLLIANAGTGGLGVLVPPRPPPPVLHSPDNTEVTVSDQQVAEAIEGHEDDRMLPALRSPGSDDADQISGQLPLVFRPGSGRSPGSDDAEQISGQLPLVFRPGSGSNQTDSQDDDSPPAIPPRVRIRKHARQGKSYCKYQKCKSTLKNFEPRHEKTCFLHIGNQGRR